MGDMHPVRYARSGDVHIAYMSLGEGPEEFLWTPGASSNVEDVFLANRALFAGLAETGRVTWFDKRGTGLSDRNADFTFEERIDDIRAVMDASGIETAHLIGASEGGPMSILFAATYPDRVKSLTLYATFPSWRRRPDYPAGIPDSPSGYMKFVERIVASFAGDDEATRWIIELFAPSMTVDEAVLEGWKRGQNRRASPGSARVIWEGLYEIDVRHALKSVQVPTAIIHFTGDRVVPVEGSRYLASHIAGARLVELPGNDHLFVPAEAMLEAIRENVRLARDHEVETHRRLATVLFSDLVSSTEHAARAGDASWRKTLDQHDKAASELVARFGGKVVKSTGDGMLATFEGPSSAVRCGVGLHAAVAPLDLDIRVGMHAGEIETRGEDVAGIGVHIAARVAALAGAGETLVSSTVKDLTVGSGFRYADRGSHTLKGVPDEWHLYAAAV